MLFRLTLRDVHESGKTFTYQIARWFPQAFDLLTYWIFFIFSPVRGQNSVLLQQQ